MSGLSSAYTWSNKKQAGTPSFKSLSGDYHALMINAMRDAFLPVVCTNAMQRYEYFSE